MQDVDPPPDSVPGSGSGDDPRAVPGGGVGESTGGRRRRGRHRLAGYLLLAVTGLLVVAGAWLAVTAVSARAELLKVKADLGRLKSQVTAGDLAAARATAGQLEQHARRAHTLTTGPAWAVAAAVPAAGAPLNTVRVITAQADALASTTVPSLLTISQQLDPKHLRLAGNRYDVAAIAGAAPAIHRAVASAEGVTAQVQALPARTWLPAVDRGRDELVGKLSDLTNTLAAIDRASSVLPAMLGADGPKRYFVGFENDSEARGLGGLPGAFAIVVADHGTITFTHLEDDRALNETPSGITLGPEYARRYGDTGLDLYPNSTISPNFPWVARIWSAMWQQKSGEHVDGAIAVDPTAMSYLLAVTGPATLPSGQQVGADNVVALTESAAYEQFGTDNAARKQFLLEIASAVQHQVLSDGSDPAALVRAGDKAAIERRLLVWSSDPSVEAALQKSSLGGQLPATDQPFTGVVVTNAAGSKLDYYLDRTVTYIRSGCGATRDVTVRVTLTNSAPASGLSSYVTVRADNPTYPVKPGDNRLLVSLYATRGATITSATVEGEPALVTAATEVGHPVWTSEVELPRGTSRSFVYHLVEPAGSGPVTVLRQPLVRPLTETVTDRGCVQ